MEYFDERLSGGCTSLSRAPHQPLIALARKSLKSQNNQNYFSSHFLWGGKFLKVRFAPFENLKSKILEDKRPNTQYISKTTKKKWHIEDYSIFFRIDRIVDVLCWKLPQKVLWNGPLLLYQARNIGWIVILIQYPLNGGNRTPYSDIRTMPCVFCVCTYSAAQRKAF